MSLRRLLFATLLILVPAIANAADYTVGLPADAAGAPADSRGTVIGTIGFRADNTAKVHSAAIYFRKIGSSDTGFFQIVRPTLGLGGNAKDLVDGKFHYAAFELPLTEGSYELIRVVGLYPVGGQDPLLPHPVEQLSNENYDPETRALKYSNKQDFSVPFEVKSGKVLYLGSFLAHGTLEKGKVFLIPMPTPSTVYFSYADKWERDKAAFASIPSRDDAERASLLVNERTEYYIIAEDHLPEPKVKMRDYSEGRTTHAAKIAAYKAAQANERQDASQAESSAAISEQH